MSASMQTPGGAPRQRLGSLLTTRGQSFTTSSVVLLVAGYTLGLGDLARLGLLLALLVVVALVTARRVPRTFEVHRQVLPAAPVVGDHAEVELTVRNPHRRLLGTLVATELLPRVLGDRPRFLVPPLRSGEACTVRYVLRPRHRGEASLGPLMVQVRDGFGLTTRDVPAGERHTVLVHPRPVPLPGQALGAVDAGGAGGPSHGAAASGTDDLSVREYRHGDELRRIHWKATAHTGELMVRQEERPARRSAVVLLDSRASNHWGEGDSSTFEWAVTCAASVVRHLGDLGLDVVLVTDHTASAARTRSGLDDPMAVLARARTGSDEGFASAVHTVDEIAEAGALVVAVLGAGGRSGADVGGTRHPSSRGIAVVVAAEGAAGGQAARHTAESLTGRGWLAGTATPGSDIAEAWSRATSGSGRLLAEHR